MPKKSEANLMLEKQRKELFAEVYARTNSPMKAIQEAYPEFADKPQSAAVKGNRLIKKADIQEKIQRKLEAKQAIVMKNIGDMLKSDNEEIKFKTTKLTMEHLRGKPVARHIGLTATASLEDVLAALK